MQRPKSVTLTLTPEQHEALRPLYDALDEYANGENADDYGVLIAQPHSPDERVEKAGTMPVHFLFGEEGRAVWAVLRLMKLNGGPDA